MTIPCCVKACEHTIKNCKMKRFPTSTNTHVQWLLALRKHDKHYEFKKSHRVCHCHFTEDQFISTPNHARKPTKHAIPTIFPSLKSNKIENEVPGTSDKTDEPMTCTVQTLEPMTVEAGMAVDEENNPVGHLIPVSMDKPLRDLVPDSSILRDICGPGPSHVSLPVNLISESSTASKKKSGSVAESDFLPVSVDNERMEEFDEDREMPPVKELCRICAENTTFSSSEMVPIFGKEGVAINLAAKIKQHLPIKVKRSDRLPLLVCTTCIKALDVCHNLLLKCTQADITLQRLLLREEEEGSPIECPGDFCEAFLSDGEEEGHTVKKNKGVASADTKKRPVLPCKVQNCNVEFSSRKALIAHGKEKHNKRCCDTCFLPFDTYRDLKEHQVEAHPDWRLCDICGAAVQGKVGLRLHMDKHIPASDRKFKCNQCEAGYSRLTHLLRHQSRHAPDKPFPCSKCNKKFYNDIDLTLHNRIHADKSSYVCQLCNASFSCKRYLSNHTRRHHNDQWIYECAVCQATHFKTLTEITNHITENHQVVLGKPLSDYFYRTSRFCCESCGYYFANDKRLKDHRQKYHGSCVTKMRKKNNELFKCDKCSEMFMGEKCYQTHMKNKHEIIFNNGSMDCDQCGKSFLYRSSLLAHMIQHTKAKPFKCTYCEACFSNTTSHREHERWHRGETPFQCTYCELKFISIKLRNRHIKTHTKPYLCKYCGKSFAKNSYCVVHERVHTGELPFKCKFCPKGFKQKQEMEFHQLSHTKEKKFSCSLCNFGDNKLKIIQQHIQSIHVGLPADILKHDFS